MEQLGKNKRQKIMFIKLYVVDLELLIQLANLNIIMKQVLAKELLKLIKME
jgi:hypothetical protein